MKKIFAATFAFVILCVGDLAVQAQDRIFLVTDYTHIPQGRRAEDYIAVEKLWQRRHQKAVDAGICLGWTLFRVENGGRTDFVTVRAYDSLDKSINPWPESLSQGLYNSDEAKIMEGTGDSRQSIFSEVSERIAAVGYNGRVDFSLVNVRNYMKSMPGKDALNIEATVYSKIQAEAKKAGLIEKWAVAKRLYPSGKDMNWDYYTANWFTKKQMTQAWDGEKRRKIVEAALGKEEAAKLPDNATWRTRVRNEIWYPILATEPRSKK